MGFDASADQKGVTRLRSCKRIGDNAGAKTSCSIWPAPKPLAASLRLAGGRLCASIFCGSPTANVTLESFTASQSRHPNEVRTPLPNPHLTETTAEQTHSDNSAN